MVARQQDIRYSHRQRIRGVGPVHHHFRRPCELGKIQQSAAERVVGHRLLVADDSGHEARDRVEDDERRQFPARQHVVANRQLLGHAPPDPIVESFVSAAQEHDVLVSAQPPRLRLHEPFALRRRQDHRERRAARRLDRVERAEDRIRLQHHPRAAAVRHIVDHAMPIGREVAEVVHLHVERAARNRPPEDARRERLPNHRRENGDDIECQETLRS